MNAAAKEINIHLMPGDYNAPLGGICEPGVSPIGAAPCDAIFAATGKRIRQLPVGGSSAQLEGVASLCDDSRCKRSRAVSGSENSIETGIRMHARRVVTLAVWTFIGVSTVAHADCLLIANRTLELRVHQGGDELGDGPLLWEGWLAPGQRQYITAPQRIRYYYRFNTSEIWQSLSTLCSGGVEIAVP